MGALHYTVEDLERDRAAHERLGLYCWLFRYSPNQSVLIQQETLLPILYERVVIRLPSMKSCNGPRPRRKSLSRWIAHPRVVGYAARSSLLSGNFHGWMMESWKRSR